MVEENNIKLEERGNTFVLSVDGEKAIKEDWNKVNEFMDIWQEEMINYEKRLAQELDISPTCASAINYLRTRSRHTPEMEQKLIDMDKNGEKIPFNEVLTGEWKG